MRQRYIWLMTILLRKTIAVRKQSIVRRHLTLQLWVMIILYGVKFLLATHFPKTFESGAALNNHFLGLLDSNVSVTSNTPKCTPSCHIYRHTILTHLYIVDSVWSGASWCTSQAWSTCKVQGCVNACFKCSDTCLCQACWRNIGKTPSRNSFKHHHVCSLRSRPDLWVFVKALEETSMTGLLRSRRSCLTI